MRDHQPRFFFSGAASLTFTTSTSAELIGARAAAGVSLAGLASPFGTPAFAAFLRAGFLAAVLVFAGAFSFTMGDASAVSAVSLLVLTFFTARLPEEARAAFFAFGAVFSGASG